MEGATQILAMLLVSWYLTIFQFIYQFVFIGLEQADGAFNWEENWWWRGMLVEQ